MTLRRLAHPMLLAMLLGLILTMTPQQARAACAGPVPQAEGVAAASSVFVGRVVALTDLDRTATMDVVEVWKGPNLPRQVIVHGGGLDTAEALDADDRTYKVGLTYLVVPDNSAPPFFDSTCSATTAFSPAGAIPADLVDAVEGSQLRVYGASAGGPAWWLIPAIVLGAIVMLALVLGVARRSSGGSAPGSGRRRKLSKRRFSIEGTFGKSGLDTVERLRSEK
jgi:hypothetical protein